MSNIPECPPSLKSIQHYLKTAAEHDTRDIVVAYWCRLYALQMGLKITKKAPEETKMLISLMDWLEEIKKANKENEAITNEVAAQAHLENYALKLFLYADQQDRALNFGKNVVKAFYTAGMIYDVLTTFGELTDEATQNRKYAKWKAAYIHNCLKNGETPIPGSEFGVVPCMLATLFNGPLLRSGLSPQLRKAGSILLHAAPMRNGGDTGPMQSEDEQNDESTADGSETSDTQNMGFTNVNPASPPTIPTSFSNSLPDPNAAIIAASQLPPVPYTPDPNPGGFVPYDPSEQPQPAMSTTLYGDNSTTGAKLSPDQIAKAQKYCKWASSALNYDDIPTAINNLKNALELLQTGRDPA